MKKTTIALTQGEISTILAWARLAEEDGLNGFELELKDRMEDTLMYGAFVPVVQSTPSNRKSLDLIWNGAVAKVSSQENTLANFLRIKEQFLKDAQDGGYSEAEATGEVKETYESVKNFFTGE